MALQLEVGKRYKNKTTAIFQIVALTPEAPSEVTQTAAKPYNKKYIGVFFGTSHTEPVSIDEHGNVYRPNQAGPSWILSEEYVEPVYSYINVYDGMGLGAATTCFNTSADAAKKASEEPFCNYLHTLKLDPISGKTTVFKHGTNTWA